MRPRNAATIALAAVLSVLPARTAEPVPTDAAHLLPGVVEKPKPADPRAIVRERASRDRGWTGREWRCLHELIRRESRWDPNADNPRSTAQGLFQVLRQQPGLSVEKQTTIGIRYIAHRYDTPCRALAFHDRKGWY